VAAFNAPDDDSVSTNDIVIVIALSAGATRASAAASAASAPLANLSPTRVPAFSLSKT
jgi:hypothetical protein